jgi:hypothetical protein
MEPDKFEKHIKKQMQEREISPSPNAWDKISTQLPVPEETNSKGFFWYGVAAAFIGILFLASLYFNTSSEAIESEIQIVETPEEPTDNPKINEVLVSQDANEEKNTISDEKEIKDATSPKEQVAINHKPEALFVATGDDNEIVKKVDAVPTGTDQLINAKISEIMAQVNLLEDSNLPVSSKEVDSLLRNAQQEILTDNGYSHEGEVDALALLNEVEGELDKSFREQIFESLKTGFVKVRTAVADRNN